MIGYQWVLFHGRVSSDRRPYFQGPATLLPLPTTDNIVAIVIVVVAIVASVVVRLVGIFNNHVSGGGCVRLLSVVEEEEA